MEDRMTDANVRRMIELVNAVSPQNMDVTLPQIKLDVEPNMRMLIKKLGLLLFIFRCYSGTIAISLPLSAPWWHCLWNMLLHLLFDISFIPLTRLVITFWGVQPMWPVLNWQSGFGWCQAQSIPRPDPTRSWGWRCHQLVVLSLLPYLQCSAAIHLAAVEWQGQCATLYWPSVGAIRNKNGERQMSRKQTINGVCLSKSKPYKIASVYFWILM